MTSPLTILCVTEYGDHSGPFLADMEEIAEQLDAALVIYDGRDAGYLEHALGAAVYTCPDGYILRLDDDERCSPQMVDWLEDHAWLEHDHWAFPRLNLWPNPTSYITSHALYPDLQTRLSVKSKASGRTRIHQGSPYGTGHVAPCAIEHWKFLVRSLDERRALLARYEAILPGAGNQFTAFSCPEFLCPVATADLAHAMLRDRV